MENKISPSSLVLNVYPKAKPIKVKNHVEIWSENNYLGQGKNNKCAWKAALKNIND
jgi:hypothetical protein